MARVRDLVLAFVGFSAVMVGVPALGSEASAAGFVGSHVVHREAADCETVQSRTEVDADSDGETHGLGPEALACVSPNPAALASDGRCQRGALAASRAARAARLVDVIRGPPSRG